MFLGIFSVSSLAVNVGSDETIVITQKDILKLRVDLDPGESFADALLNDTSIREKFKIISGSPEVHEAKIETSDLSLGEYALIFQIEKEGEIKQIERKIIVNARPGSAPEIINLEPNTGDTGWLGRVTIYGNNFQKDAVPNLGEGIAFANLDYKKIPLEISAEMAIAAEAAAGFRDITVINPDGKTFVLAKGFEVIPKPFVTSIAPPGERQGASRPVKFFGRNLQKDTVFDLGAGVEVGSYDYSKVPHEIDAVITIDSGASPGLRDVNVTNPDGKTSLLSNAFMIKEVLSVAYISPDSGIQGKAVEIAITGAGFTTKPKVKIMKAGKIISARKALFVSPNLITGKILIPRNAPPGNWNVVVTGSDGQSFTLEGGFEIKRIDKSNFPLL